MLFTDFDGRQCAIRLELVRRIETVSADSIEESSGSSRAVIDGVILPLVGLPSGALPADRIRLLRIGDGGCEVLLAVRDIKDAVALTDKLKPVAEDPLVEAVTLIEGQQVALLDGHELFARYGEPPEQLERPLCRLPDGDWAQSILGPLVESAGYQVIAADDNTEGAISIMFEDIYNVTQALDKPISGPVIRLRDQPDAPAHENTIYRYDREGLIEALRRAQAGGQA
jgi:two-component system chemotaxis sensor kinase CheA